MHDGAHDDFSLFGRHGNRKYLTAAERRDFIKAADGRHARE